MIAKIFFTVSLLGLLLFACIPAPVVPTATPFATFTSTVTNTATATATLTPTATIIPTATVTPIQFQMGQFSTSGPVAYYFDASLRKSTGKWDGEFYICARYFSQRYDSFLIAESPVDCVNDEPLGWVPISSVVMPNDEFPMALTTVIPSDKKQCENGIDDDRDSLIDYPLDPGCPDANDDWEDERPPVTATLARNKTHK
jgi:hypothetical protein